MSSRLRGTLVKCFVCNVLAKEQLNWLDRYIFRTPKARTYATTVSMQGTEWNGVFVVCDGCYAWAVKNPLPMRYFLTGRLDAVHKRTNEE